MAWTNGAHLTLHAICEATFDALADGLTNE